jgi:proteasome lid subunit RPN8/RPN11
MMALHLAPPLQARLAQWAREGYPREGCGLLLGRPGADGVLVDEVLQVRNAVAGSGRDRYELDPQDLLRADMQARERGSDIVGIWHTHPDHPAQPSPTDREQAWSGWVYLILSVTAEGVQAMRAWRLCGAGFVEEEVHP